MSVITPFRKKENDSENSEKRPSLGRRLFAHKMRIFGVVAIAVIAVIVAIVILYVSYSNKLYKSYSVKKSVKYHRVEGTNVLSFDDKFLTYSKDGIHCTDSKGKDRWSVPYEMQNPVVAKRGEYVAVTDTNGREVHVFNFNGELGTIRTVSPIKNMAISGDGVVVVVTEEDNLTLINVYYYDGGLIATFRTTMDKSGYPVDIGISDNSKLIAVSYLYVDSGKLTSKVAFYNFGDVGQNEIDNLVSGYDYEGKVIPIIEFLDDRTAFALANDRLMFYSGKERPTNTANIELKEEVQSVFYGDDNVGLLYMDTSGKGKYRIDIYSSSGKKISSHIFTMEFTDIFFANGMVVIYNSTEALIYKESGRKKFEGKFSDSVSLMIPTSSPIKYVLVTQDAIKTIQLK